MNREKLIEILGDSFFSLKDLYLKNNSNLIFPLIMRFEDFIKGELRSRGSLDFSTLEQDWNISRNIHPRELGLKGLDAQDFLENRDELYSLFEEYSLKHSGKKDLFEDSFQVLLQEDEEYLSGKELLDQITSAIDLVTSRGYDVSTVLVSPANAAVIRLELSRRGLIKNLLEFRAEPTVYEGISYRAISLTSDLYAYLTTIDPKNLE